MPPPAWVLNDAWKPLNPPAEVMAFGDSRSADNLLAAGNSVHVLEALRYQPTPVATFCNILAADVCQILRAPLPHTVDGKERTINAVIASLRSGAEPGWSKVPDSLHAANLAQTGVPVIAVWPNPAGHGHIVVCMPRPVGITSGVYCTGAGRACLQQQPLAKAFGALISQVEFYCHA